MDTVVFDIETKNFFTDPGVGRDNFAALEISVVGVYSYERDEYTAFAEDEIEELADVFRGAGRIVGFASNRFDIPVLNLYFQKCADRAGLNLWGKERLDLLERVETATGGRRISLDLLAEANLGAQKSGTGSDAPRMYARGDIAALKKYCLRDVELTKRLYDLFCERQELVVPRKTGGSETITFTSTSAPTGTLL